MRVAFIGTRGVPATYSGFETFVEQVGSRLADRGHEVTVYCRRHHSARRLDEYRGMRLVYVPGVASKHLDTISHTFVSCLHALFGRYDLVLMCISGNSPTAILPRLVGSKVVLNVDGSDWRRRKWGQLARAYIRASEWLAVHFPNATVTDSAVMKRYYLDRFGTQTTCISYGADLPEPRATGILRELGLEPRRYLLLVGRLVPENCADHLVDAYQQIKESGVNGARREIRCVVVGDAPYAREYIAELHRKGPDVVFPGYVFGDGYRELMHNAYAVVLGSEVGGTHPVLLEAMAAGNCVVVNDTPANLEVIADAGVPYRGELGAAALAEVLRDLLCDPARVRRYGQLARERALTAYSWHNVTNQYEDLFEALTGLPRPREPVHRKETRLEVQAYGAAEGSGES